MIYLRKFVKIALKKLQYLLKKNEHLETTSFK